jgi:uncharacterized membrane protein (TIGR02234 family)
VTVSDDAPAAPAAGRPRSYLVALVSLALGAALLLVASGRTWATVVFGGDGLPTIAVDVTGSELVFTGPLAVLALAGIGGLLALRRVGRVIAGIVLAAAGAGVTLQLVVFGTTYDSSLGARDWIVGVAGERAGVEGYGSITVDAWWVPTLLGAILVAVSGVLAMVASGSWPTLGRRYERGGEGARGPASAATTASSTWDQLDQGIDPTDGSDPAAGPGPGQPT